VVYLIIDPVWKAPGKKPAISMHPFVDARIELKRLDIRVESL
jgi:hypothetical protein